MSLPNQGWEYLHVCIDDASRIAYTDLLPNQKARSAIAHLKAALAYYRRLGVTVKRVMTDNGPCYTSHAFANACKQFGLKHIRTKPYTPRTNLPAAGRRQGRTLHPCLQQAGKPPCANGPMPELTKPQHSAPRTCHYGRTAIIGIDLIAA